MSGASGGSVVATDPPGLTYGSVCSGIEGASVAWEPLGWRPAWFAEVDPFASAVLAHRWPDVPNLGDFTRIGKEVPCAEAEAQTSGRRATVPGAGQQLRRAGGSVDWRADSNG